MQANAYRGRLAHEKMRQMTIARLEPREIPSRWHERTSARARLVAHGGPQAPSTGDDAVTTINQLEQRALSPRRTSPSRSSVARSLIESARQRECLDACELDASVLVAKA